MIVRLRDEAIDSGLEIDDGSEDAALELAPRLRTWLRSSASAQSQSTTSPATSSRP
jgi:hypothetical protein